jgi:hypothetical protein
MIIEKYINVYPLIICLTIFFLYNSYAILEQQAFGYHVIDAARNKINTQLQVIAQSINKSLNETRLAIQNHNNAGALSSLNSAQQQLSILKNRNYTFAMATRLLQSILTPISPTTPQQPAPFPIPPSGNQTTTTTTPPPPLPSTSSSISSQNPPPPPPPQLPSGNLPSSTTPLISSLPFPPSTSMPATVSPPLGSPPLSSQVSPNTGAPTTTSSTPPPPPPSSSALTTITPPPVSPPVSSQVTPTTGAPSTSSTQSLSPTSHGPMK